MAISQYFVFIAFVGGPIINFPGHNQASRQASASQVTLTDGVSPAAPMSPVVGLCTRLHHCIPYRGVGAVYTVFI